MSQTMNSCKVAICITTRNRPKYFYRCMQSITRHIVGMPDVRIFVVDDTQYPDDLYTYLHPSLRLHIFGKRAGIPRAKNMCLEMAMAAGAEHIFLLDDDVVSLSPESFKRYIESPYKHLCYTFLPSYRNLDEQHQLHSLANGCMMYIHRSVVDTIGGFDTAFGLGKYEHPHFSHRAHAAGLIPHPFIDLKNSGNLFYCSDQDNKVERSFDKETNDQLLRDGSAHYHKTRNLTNFIPYKSE